MTATDLVTGCLLVAFLLTFPAACTLANERRNRSRFWWTLNRVRAAIAFEDDPGPWSNK